MLAYICVVFKMFCFRKRKIPVGSYGGGSKQLNEERRKRLRSKQVTRASHTRHVQAATLYQLRPVGYLLTAHDVTSTPRGGGRVSAMMMTGVSLVVSRARPVITHGREVVRRRRIYKRCAIVRFNRFTENTAVIQKSYTWCYVTGVASKEQRLPRTYKGQISK